MALRGVGQITVDRVLRDHHTRIRVLEAIGEDLFHYVDAVDEPPFENSWVNQGGGLVPMRFRMLVDAPPRRSARGLELQGSVTGGANGTTIFTLPQLYWPDYELRLPASDDAGAYVVYRVLANGEVKHGI